jgi:hypothetical protein
MSADRRSFERLRDHARQARETGDYPQAARLERQAAELAGALGLPGQQARALLWEGYSLRHAGQDDLALAVLLQAIHESAPTVDPADRFSALTTLLHISLERKSARFCRALLEQGRRDLAESRQLWSTLLDFLEGELAFRQGDFAAAWDWHERAWAKRRDTHPRLTPATHLWALCRTAFRRREPADLEQLTHQLVQLRPNSALEQQLVLRAQWLHWRAQYVSTSTSPANATLVEPARAFLTTIAEEREPRDFAARLEALRVLALAGDWEFIDAHGRHNPLPPDTFETALGLGDLALNRARVALKLPTIDDDYGAIAIEIAAAPAAPDPDRAVAMLNEAEHYYQEAGRFAAEQDQRLQTGEYGDTIQKRQTRLHRLHALKAGLRAGVT